MLRTALFSSILATLGACRDDVPRARPLALRVRYDAARGVAWVARARGEAAPAAAERDRLFVGPAPLHPAEMAPDGGIALTAPLHGVALPPGAAPIFLRVGRFSADGSLRRVSASYRINSRAQLSARDASSVIWTDAHGAQVSRVELERPTAAPCDYPPRLSPDGKSLYLAQPGPEGAQLYRIDTGDRVIHRLADLPGEDVLRGSPLAVSPRSDRVALLTRVNAGKARLRVMEAGGAAIGRWDLPPGEAVRVGFEPDGKALHVALGAEEGCRLERVVIGAEETTPWLEAAGWSDCRDVEVAPDGEGAVGVARDDQGAAVILRAGGGPDEVWYRTQEGSLALPVLADAGHTVIFVASRGSGRDAVLSVRREDAPQAKTIVEAGSGFAIVDLVASPERLDLAALEQLTAEGQKTTRLRIWTSEVGDLLLDEWQGPEPGHLRWWRAGDALLVIPPGAAPRLFQREGIPVEGALPAGFCGWRGGAGLVHRTAGP